MKFKINKEGIASGVLAITLMITTMGCAKQSNNDNSNNASNTTSVVSEYEEVNLVNELSSKLSKLLPNTNYDVCKDTSIILLLDLICKRDENYKISSDILAHLEDSVNADCMLDNFLNCRSRLMNEMLEKNKLVRISDILPDELDKDKNILSKIENVANNIISNNGNSKKINEEFNKLYNLFVLEKDVTFEGLTFNLRDLGYSRRAIAEDYAKIAITYARNYVDQTRREELEHRTDGQSNHPYLKEIISVAGNSIISKSQSDVSKIFNDKYSEIETLLKNKINTTNSSIKTLVNIANLKYLESEKVNDIDSANILEEYDPNEINEAIDLIDAIVLYDSKNTNDMILLSDLLINDFNKIDSSSSNKVALDYTLFNIINLLNNYDSKYDLRSNISGEEIYIYIKGLVLTHVYGNNDTYTVYFSNVSNGVDFINNEAIVFALNSLGINDSYITVAEKKLQSSIQSVQNDIKGECYKADYNEYYKK